MGRVAGFLQGSGLTVLSIAGFMVHTVAGLVVMGVSLLAVGVSLERRL